MPAFHPEINEAFQKACATALLPIISTVNGPAPRPSQKNDIIDVALRYFKANVLFRKYPLREGDEGAQDRTLLYLMFFIQSCLRKIEEKRCTNEKDGEKALMAYALESFDGPGDANFVLQGFIPNAESPAEKAQWMEYFKQVRQEVVKRLVKKVFQNTEDGGPNKFWMQFAKRKFLGKEIRL